MAVTFSNASFIRDEGNENNTTSIPILDYLSSRTTRFWLLLIFEIPSLICTLFLLLCFLMDPTLRKALNNHTVIILLISILLIQSFDVPNYMGLARLGYVWPPISITCYLWQFVYSGIFSMISFLVAWMSVERHIFIFHQKWLDTRNKRIFVHYLPLITLVLYVLTFYMIIIIFPSCETTIDYTVNYCGFPCSYSNLNIWLYDSIVNSIVPNISMIISNTFLLIRVAKQKRRLRQKIQWNKYRRMIIQLVSCSSLYLLLNLPVVSLNLAHITGVSFEASAPIDFYMFFMGYFIVLWMPFLCFASTPEIWNKMKRMVIQRHNVIEIVPLPIITQPVPASRRRSDNAIIRNK